MQKLLILLITALPLMAQTNISNSIAVAMRSGFAGRGSGEIVLQKCADIVSIC